MVEIYFNKDTYKTYMLNTTTGKTMYVTNAAGRKMASLLDVKIQKVSGHFLSKMPVMATYELGV